MSDKVDRLLPGQTREIPLDPAGTGATAEVTAVILQDATALGDQETIASVFEHRARERDQLRQVVDVFDAVLPSARGVAALEDLKRGFAVQAPQGESAAHQSAREAVDAYLQRATPATADAIDQLVRKYADIVRREYELAEKHSRRKN
jgi:DNA polymerase III delta prime subunit